MDPCGLWVSYFRLALPAEENGVQGPSKVDTADDGQADINKHVDSKGHAGDTTA